MYRPKSRAGSRAPDRGRRGPTPGCCGAEEARAQQASARRTEPSANGCLESEQVEQAHLFQRDLVRLRTEPRQRHEKQRSELGMFTDSPMLLLDGYGSCPRTVRWPGRVRIPAQAPPRSDLVVASVGAPDRARDRCRRAPSTPLQSVWRGPRCTARPSAAAAAVTSWRALAGREETAISGCPEQYAGHQRHQVEAPANRVAHAHAALPAWPDSRTESAPSLPRAVSLSDADATSAISSSGGSPRLSPQMIGAGATCTMVSRPRRTLPDAWPSRARAGSRASRPRAMQCARRARTSRPEHRRSSAPDDADADAKAAARVVRLAGLTRWTSNASALVHSQPFPHAVRVLHRLGARSRIRQAVATRPGRSSPSGSGLSRRAERAG